MNPFDNIVRKVEQAKVEASKKSCVIYTRFSPRKNASDSESCKVQEDACREYAKANGHAIKAVYNDENISGKDESREKLWDAINSLDKGDILLVHKQDRLARNVYLSECIRREVEKSKATLESVEGNNEDTKEAQLQRQMLAAFAEYERKCIAERTSAAMRFKQRNGQKMSRHPPFGWNFLDKRLVPVSEEQDVISLMRTLTNGGMTPKKVARTLNDEGIKTRAGGPWNTHTVSKVINRDINTI